MMATSTTAVITDTSTVSLPKSTVPVEPTLAKETSGGTGGAGGGGISAIDKLVFDATVEVTRADGIQMVVSFQFYFRHYEGMQDVIKNSDGFSVKKLRMPMIKTYSMRKRRMDINVPDDTTDLAQYMPDPSEVVVIFPSKLMEISYKVEEETLILESAVPLTPTGTKNPKENNNHNNNNEQQEQTKGASKVTIRYKADEPGNISHQAWVSGAAQVATAFQRWYTFVRRRAVDDKEGEALATILRTQPGPSRSRAKKLGHILPSSIAIVNKDDNTLVSKMDHLRIDKISHHNESDTNVHETSFTSIPEIHAEPPSSASSSATAGCNDIVYTKPVPVRPTELHHYQSPQGFSPSYSSSSSSSSYPPPYYHSMNSFQPINDDASSVNTSTPTGSSTVRPSVTNATPNRTVPATGGKFKLGKYQVTTDPSSIPNHHHHPYPSGWSHPSENSSTYHRQVPKMSSRTSMNRPFTHGNSHPSSSVPHTASNSTNTTHNPPTVASKEIRRIMELQNQLQVASASVMEKLASIDGSNQSNNYYTKPMTDPRAAPTMNPPPATTTPSHPPHTYATYANTSAYSAVNSMRPSSFSSSTTVNPNYVESETSSTNGYYGEPPVSSSVPVNTTVPNDNPMYPPVTAYNSYVTGNNMMVPSLPSAYANGTAYLPSYPQYITYATGPNGTPVAMLLPQPMRYAVPTANSTPSSPSSAHPSMYAASSAYGSMNYNTQAYVPAINSTADGSSWNIPSTPMMMMPTTNGTVPAYTVPLPYYTIYTAPTHPTPSGTGTTEQ